MKNCYLIITDIHASYKNKDSRHNYLKEIDYVFNMIIKIADKYKNSGYKVTLLFAGDITDNSYKDQVKAILLNNIFVYLKLRYGVSYVAVGNHEFSYYKDNPFWSLMTTIHSAKIKEVINKTWQPRGLLQLVNVSDELVDGEVCFHFNHHATSIARPDDTKINIGIFHKDIICSAILEDMKQNMGLDNFTGKPIYLDKTNVLRGYDYAFFGHLHKVYGQWAYEDDKTGHTSNLYYLASLGRPNHTEVQDNFLERNIPVVIVEDGKFKEVQDNFFNLMSRTSCVKEDVIKHNQEVYQLKKEKEFIIKYMPEGDNPVENIKGALAYDNSLLKLFEYFLDDDVIQYEHDLIDKVGRL